MKFEFLMEYHADLKPEGEAIGHGPFGTRHVAIVEGGEFEGPRLRGTLEPTGGDWLLRDERGVTRLDVRVTLRTHDGAQIYVQYFGIARPPPAGSGDTPQGARRATEYGERYFMTTPRFETGDERYLWLNDLVCVAEGRVTQGGVAYRVFTVEND